MKSLEEVGTICASRCITVNLFFEGISRPVSENPYVLDLGAVFQMFFLTFQENERHSARAASLKRLNEEVANSAGDPGVRRGLFKEKRWGAGVRRLDHGLICLGFQGVVFGRSLLSYL